MKKLVLLLLLFALPLILFSCSDDIEDSVEDTIWVANSGQETLNLKFRKSIFTIEIWKGNTWYEEQTISGTYTYDYPTVVFYYDDIQEETTIIDKKQIRLSLGEGSSYLFTKR